MTIYERCTFGTCRARLCMGFPSTCRCGMRVCKKHYHKHECNYDYKKKSIEAPKKYTPKWHDVPIGSAC